MESPNQQEKKNPPFNNFLKFSGLGIQMGATLALFAWVGHWLDGYVHNPKSLFTLGFLLLGTIASILSLIRQLK